MGDLDLCYLSASEALSLFRAKELSPVELMQAVIRRAEKTEQHINAFTYTYFDEALEQARKAEAKYASGKRTRALEGLPVGIKDESYIKGLPTSNGSLTLKDFVPEETSPVNERILRAGGIVHARTATPEFSCAGYTHSKLWGVTRNPWNFDKTPGGSSGGSSASLAAGTSALCSGSDIGGSIRIPAGACGLVGYKPPYGRNPELPPFNFDFYCHNGPLARTVEDAALLQNVMCGPHDRDIATLRPKLTLPTDHKPISGWKIAYSHDLGFFEVDPDVRDNMDRALEVFRSLGAQVEPVELDWNEEVLSAGLAYLDHIFGAYIGEVLEKQADLLTPYARAFGERGRNSTPEKYLRTLEIGGNMYHAFARIMKSHQVLICPTNALPAVPADFDQSRDTVTINGRNVDPMLGWVMTLPFNTLSRCPVLSVPSGRASYNVPTGIQIVGNTYRDVDVFRAAAAYQNAVPELFVSAQNHPELQM